MGAWRVQDRASRAWASFAGSCRKSCRRSGRRQLSVCSQTSFLLPHLVVLVSQTGCHHGHWIKDRGWYEASHWQMRPIMERDLVLTAGFHCQYIPGKALKLLASLCSLLSTCYICFYWSCKTTSAPWPYFMNRRCDSKLKFKSISQHEKLQMKKNRGAQIRSLLEF